MRLDLEAFKQIGALKLKLDELASGQLQADRRSARRGRGMEFADYREYQPGDDLRLVDWNIFGRLDQLLVRLFHEDVNMTVHIALDATASMAFGEPTKADYGATLAGALAIIGLKNQDHVTLSCLGGRGPRNIAKGHNMQAFGSFTQLLEQTTPASNTALAKVIDDQLSQKRLDRLVLISDMLQPAEVNALTLRALARRAKGAALIHVLSQEELNPNLDSPTHITDAETGQTLLIPGGAAAKAQYQKILAAWLEQTQQQCRSLGLGYMRVSTQDPLVGMLTQTMRRQNLTMSAHGAAP